MFNVWPQNGTRRPPTTLNLVLHESDNSSVQDRDERVAGRSRREKCFLDVWSLICPPAKSMILYLSGPPNIWLLVTSLGLKLIPPLILRFVLLLIRVLLYGLNDTIIALHKYWVCFRQKEMIFASLLALEANVFFIPCTTLSLYDECQIQSAKVLIQ